MKKSISSILFLLFLTLLFGQNAKKIENLKDAWDLSYTYTGEVKDGKPNGMGVAVYKSGNVIRYVGTFANGMYSGKGVMFFDKGAFIAGDWKNGKLTGKGANFTESEALYIGDMKEGVRNGKGILFYKDNSIVIGSFLNDKISGRAINIWADGSIISDIHYSVDKRNGTGYQYEAKAKNLYEGEWRDDKWVQAATPYFSSFLKSSGFVGEMTDNHVLIGPTNSNKYLTDSAYYYNLKTNKRYFGEYDNGKLRNGLILGDSTRFLGAINEKGATGHCYDFKLGKYFSMGNYTDDRLNGQVLDIDLTKKSVYYGGAIDGKFTGKAYFFNDKGTMFYGDYEKGRITGNAFKMETTGRFTSGTWKEGIITNLNSVVNVNGETISGNPKTFGEAVNIAIKTYPGSFDDIYGDFVLDEDDLQKLEEIDEDGQLDFTYSLVNIPGSIWKNIIAEDFEENVFYLATFLRTDSETKAKAKYNELLSQIQSLSISNFYIKNNVKLIREAAQPVKKEGWAETVFSLPGSAGEKYKDFKVWLRQRKTGDTYIVELILGAKTEDF